MIAIENGWTESETVTVDGYNRSVQVAVLFAESVPVRVSIRTDDDHSSLSIKAVGQVLRSLGFAANSITWEAGEGANEGVAFLSGVVSTADESA